MKKKDLQKSASDSVDEIYKDALQSKNEQQQIKALLHKSKYMLTLEEEAQLNIINRFKSEIESSKNLIIKHLLENMLATMYWQYFQQNRYQFYNRTKTSEKISDDFRTWDLETLFNEIHIYYQKSLENGLMLQQEPLSNYSTLLTEAENSKDFRPTLFDLLSHNALTFYKTDENSITQPAYKFIIDDEALISDSELFINLDLKSKDENSLQFNALKIYQSLLKFHRKAEPTKAFVSNDIERLKFVSQHATYTNKQDLLLETLKTRAVAFKALDLSASYNFEIASIYKQQGNTNSNIKNEDLTNRWRIKEAFDLCNAVISNYPKSDGAKQCDILKQQILQPYIKLQAEEYTPINSASRILVNYKNLTSLDFKIYKVNNSQLDTYNKIYNASDKAKFFNKLSVFKSYTSSLKTEGDYQLHSTEIIVPKLQNGLYLIKADTNTEANVFGATHMQVTNMALVESVQNDIVHYQLINRINGDPIIDAVINITYRSNRNKTFSKMLSTDRFGKFKFNKDQSYYRAVEIRADYKDDIGIFGDYHIGRTYEIQENNNTKYNVFLFTDRSIYRPGQVVYFKGIATATKDNKTEVFANNIAKAKLKNVNGEIISELELKTNEFGSVNGEFILPNDGLTGNYTIELFCGNTTYTYFSVEEYKRPKFKAEFQPITETYKVNDSITVKGTALAFAGSNITDAKVIYRVKRQVQYPGWYYWRRPSYNSEPQEITYGESKTNDKGEFDITFMAIPDESVTKDNLPIFRYEVTADITDINGETRTATTIVNVGYHAMTLKIVAPDAIDKTKKVIEVSLISQNLNSEEISVKGTLKIYKLNAPNKVLRARPWSAPDYQVITQKEFKTLFPNDPYDNEDLLTNWDKGDLVFKADFDTEKEKIITLKKLKKWDSGKYIIVAQSKDKFGQDVKDEMFTSLYSKSDKTIADHQLFEASLDKISYKTGDVAKLTLGSAANSIIVTVEVEKDRKIISTQLVTLNNSKQTISIPVLGNDLGGFEVHCSLAAFNSYIPQSFSINVPYPKTDLEIETKTFRDKLQPGQDETWSFKIKGPKGEKVSAELLASMYDASLDEFRDHNWNFNPISRPNYYGSINKNARQSFGTTNFRLFNRFKHASGYTSQNYDQLNWFGFYFGNNYKNELRRKGVVYSSDNIRGVQELVEMKDDAVAVGGAPEAEANINSLLNLVNESPDAIYTEKEEVDSGNIQIRKNLNETAFFFPELQTDAEGNVSFNFTAPEALTSWKLQLLTHTKTLESAVTQLEAVTQKELMVIPNAPRFLREGDMIVISTKIANLTDTEVSGKAQLILINPLTNEEVSSSLIINSKIRGQKSIDINNDREQSFTVDSKGNTQVSWILMIPEGIQAVQYKIIAKAGDFSDGEQNTLPVLSNRMLVTETMPMWIRSNQTKTFTLDKLKNQTSTTLSHHKLTLEMTSNPAWYAVQALPYLMEYPYDCNEQTFSRYYANALAQHIVKSNPKIEAVFKPMEIIRCVVK